MEKLYKLKLLMICLGLALASFQNKISHYLTSGATHKVVRMEESHFTCAATWSNCDEAENGFLARLDEELVVFKKSNQAREH